MGFVFFVYASGILCVFPGEKNDYKNFKEMKELAILANALLLQKSSYSKKTKNKLTFRIYNSTNSSFKDCTALIPIWEASKIKLKKNFDSIPYPKPKYKRR